MSAGQSAGAHAQALRAGARKGFRRRLLSAVGYTRHTREADAQAARWAHGAAGETATAHALEQLRGCGWHMHHDRALPRSRANLDHLLISPCGTGVVVLDTKAWHRGRDTSLVGGRVYCGTEDRHAELEKVVRYARRVRDELGVGGVDVVPLLVVHGSRVDGGHLDVRVPGLVQPVYVLAPNWLVSTLAAVAVRSVPNPRAAAALAGRVDVRFPRYRPG